MCFFEENFYLCLRDEINTHLLCWEMLCCRNLGEEGVWGNMCQVFRCFEAVFKVFWSLLIKLWDLKTVLTEPYHEESFEREFGHALKESFKRNLTISLKRIVP